MKITTGLTTTYLGEAGRELLGTTQEVFEGKGVIIDGIIKEIMVMEKLKNWDGRPMKNNDN